MIVALFFYSRSALRLGGCLRQIPSAAGLLACFGMGGFLSLKRQTRAEATHVSMRGRVPPQRPAPHQQVGVKSMDRYMQKMEMN